MENYDDTITLEVKSRLNDLFGETVHGGGDATQREKEDASPLKELKSAVLSIDWEITDEGMQELVHQVELLKRRFSEDRIAALFLQLLGSVAKYIQVNKHKSHPEAFRILNTVFSGFEEAVNSPGLDEAQKKRHLYAEIVKFKKLKEKIAHERSRPAETSQAARQPSAPQAQSRLDAEEMTVDPRQARPTSAPPEPPAPPIEIEPPAEEASIFLAEPVVHAPEPDVGSPAPLPETAAKPSPPTVAELAPETLQPSAPAEVDLADALEEIKQLIREEFASLRAEVRLLSQHRG